MSRLITFTLLAAALVGCASNTVRLNPGPLDHGFRFYRPKPYLFIQPSQTSDTNDASQFVSIEWKTLPDFGEQYSIHPRAGIGINNTKIQLKDGWNLTELDADIDTKTADNIKAVGALIKSIGQFAAAGAGASPARKQLITAHLPARNVPLGFYEAVINRDPAGAKQLYGWRYIGFMPFAPCPLCMTGSQAEDCAVGQIYGLVNEGGVMVFKRIDDIAQEPVQAVHIPPAGTPMSTAQLQGVVDTAYQTLILAGNQALTAGNEIKLLNVQATDRKSVKIDVTTTMSDADYDAAKRRLQTLLQNAIRVLPGLQDVVVGGVTLSPMPPK